MRIIVCTKKDLAGAVILNHLLPMLGRHDVHVMLSDKTRGAETEVPELVEMKFLERDLPVGTLFPQIDQMGGPTGSLLTFQGLARKCGVVVESVDNVNAPETVDFIRRYAPDLILSIRFSHIFRAHVFSIPRLGTFNVHPGALPRYAGLFASFRAMMAGDAQCGTTLHRIDEGIDTGPILGIGWTEVRPDQDLMSHILRCYEPGIALFMDSLGRWDEGMEVAETPQDTSIREYRGMPGVEEFRQFRARGMRLYDPARYGTLLRQFLPDGHGGDS